MLLLSGPHKRLDLTFKGPVCRVKTDVFAEKCIIMIIFMLLFVDKRLKLRILWVWMSLFISKEGAGALYMKSAMFSTGAQNGQTTYRLFPGYNLRPHDQMPLNPTHWTFKEQLTRLKKQLIDHFEYVKLTFEAAAGDLNVNKRNQRPLLKVHPPNRQFISHRERYSTWENSWMTSSVV